MSDESTEHAEPVVVATHPTRGEAEVTRAHLEANGIDAFVVDEAEGGTMSVSGDEAVAVMVRGEDADAARAVVGTIVADTDRHEEGV